MTRPTGEGDHPWWTRRWLGLLDEVEPSDVRRVQRGQAATRRGQVEDLEIGVGVVRGRVREERSSPYEVTLHWSEADDATWARAMAALAGELRFTAAVLDGQLTEEVGELLTEVGVPLTPQVDDLQRHCGCPDRSRWCRHVVAVHTAAGQSFARDPFLLLRLRGRSRDDVLRALRAHRGGAALTAGTDLDLSRGLYDARADLDAIPLAPHPVRDPAALVRQLGDPPGVDDERPLVQVIERAAETAWRLAAGDGAEAADEALLLAELRAQRTATAATLAVALARDERAVREHLDALFAEGAVLRTGSGARVRYRAR